MLDNLKLKWEEKTPEAKRKIMLIGVAAVVITAAVLTDSGSAKRVDTKAVEEGEKSTTTRLVGGRVKDNTGDELAAQIENIRRGMVAQGQTLEGVRKRVIDADDAKNDLRSSAELVDALKSELEIMRSEVALLKSNSGGRGMTLPELKVDDTMPDMGGRMDNFAEDGQFENEVVPDAPKRPELRMVRSSSSAKAGSAGDSALLTDAGRPDLSKQNVARGADATVRGGRALVTGTPVAGAATFIPAGSILEGVLLTGMDAPTSGVGDRNPVPALVRIKADAILPNKFRHDVKECFVIMAGNGNLSSERVSLRAETLSCVRNDGGVIETQLQGYGTGEDGKVGMRGRLVSKQGAVLARSLLAGIASGFGTALKPNAVSGVNISGGNQTQFERPDIGDAAESGLFGGASSAANKLADFYLELAKDLFPILEVDAGRSVNIILVRGTNLNFGVER